MLRRLVTKMVPLRKLQVRTMLVQFLFVGGLLFWIGLFVWLYICTPERDDGPGCMMQLDGKLVRKYDERNTTGCK